MDSAKNAVSKSSEKINKKTGEPLLDHLFEPMIKWSKEGGLRGGRVDTPNLTS
ncbi:hypothetical protein [Lutispora sp.]|uniref:hypothetical protein n=1 Tax=Lutispora sp. TaxID=2828727 RepID=UPI0035634D0C